ncbi:fibronectin type III domain protein, partial [Cooperia oncophora]
MFRLTAAISVVHKCTRDDLTAPRHLEITHEGQYSLAIKWDAPECGSIGEYQVELIGEEVPFDVHRQTVTQPHVSVTNLLPATNYNIKIRAVDRQRKIGPWNSDVMQARTQGESVPVSNDIRLVYRTDSDLHFSWAPITDERAQHYEVTAVELLPESRRVERARVPPYVSGHTLAGLLPSTKYIIGVIAFVDHEPKLVYHLEAETAGEPGEIWREKPQIVDESGKFSVHFHRPPTAKPISKFLVEYRLPNETFWRTVDHAEEYESDDTYSVTLPVIPGVSVFTIRLCGIGADHELIGRTEEVTLGEAAANACVGTAGIPEE